MTHKDFELIAEAVAAERAFAVKRGDTCFCAVRAIDDVALSLAEALGEANPRFDRERFLSACGM